MLTSVSLKNFGPLARLEWKKLGRLNLVLGGNGSGKTFLLKALYTALRTLEDYKRGKERRSADEILSEKLYWTFQVDRLGDLVTKGSSNGLAFSCGLSKGSFAYRFGKDTEKRIGHLENKAKPRPSHSIFLPAKEVLSLLGVILKSRTVDRSFGFDDTYLDLAQALQNPPTKGRNYAGFALARTRLEEIVGGRVVFESGPGQWLFKSNDGPSFQIGATAEGVKKISILDTLLGNRYLDPDSILFLDEPESALHPTAISRLLDILATLAETGMQVFLATHSYFVVKKLLLLALGRKWSIPVLSFSDSAWHASDLRDGLPDNPIIDESIRLYREEIGLVEP